MHDRLVSRRIDALHQCFLVCDCYECKISCNIRIVVSGNSDGPDEPAIINDIPLV